jgi:hypothetical protein
MGAFSFPFGRSRTTPYTAASCESLVSCLPGSYASVKFTASFTNHRRALSQTSPKQFGFGYVALFSNDHKTPTGQLQSPFEPGELSAIHQVEVCLEAEA